MELQEIRKQKGLTQKEAAAFVGISLRTYTNYEQGRSKMGSFTGKTILEKLLSYEPYNENKGILPLDFIVAQSTPVFQKAQARYAILFGSYAKGKATESSDVDLLIESDVDGLAYFQCVEELRRLLHKKVDLLRFKDLQNNPVLLSEILATGKRIYG
jgi:predicted nucleotidyltransferase